MKTPQSQLTDLRQTIRDLDHAYYVLDQPRVSDAEYDELYRKLVKLEQEHPDEFDPTSPTQRLSSAHVNGFEKTVHVSPMLSLDNKFTSAEVLQYFSSVPDDALFVIEPKFDGMSLELRYDAAGVLTKAVTRGDGTTGDDVTANAKTVRSIPLSVPSEVRVRGEVIMTRDDFSVFNEEAGGVYSNPRNLASGSMKQKDVVETAKRPLQFYAYQLFGSTAEDAVGQFKYMEAAGFRVPTVRVTDKAGMATAINEMTSVVQQLPFDCDGLVVKVNDVKMREELGLGSRAPKWAVAFKFPPKRAETTLKDITVQVGRFGTITPVAELKVVELDGARVRRASLCNQDEVERLGIKVGDTVYVERAAAVIPKVVGRVGGPRHTDDCWKMPAECPSCGTMLTRGDDEAATYCPNSDKCPAQLLERLKHALSKRALDWDGMGDKQVEVLFAKGYDRLSKLFTMAEADFYAVGFTASAKKKFLSERERVKTQPFWRKLYALNIPRVGRTASQDLAVKWGSLEKATFTPDFLHPVVGQVTTVEIATWFGNDENLDELNRLEEAGFTFDGDTAAGPLTGKAFVITGALLSGTRDQVSARIEAAGGTVKGSVSKKVDFLIVGDDAGGTKTRAAEKHGTKVIKEDALYAMLGQEMPVVGAVPNSEEFEE